MNCNGDFSHLRNGKQKNQSSSYPSAESRSASQITALDNDCPEAPEAFHFGEQNVIEVGKPLARQECRCLGLSQTSRRVESRKRGTDRLHLPS
jgi:hypothetical protein